MDARQQARNRVAAATDSRPFFLFLRSFKEEALQTWQRAPLPAGKGTNTLSPFYDSGHAHILQAIEDTLARHGRLVLIGGQVRYGFGYTQSIILQTPDSRWRECFDVLSSACLAILLIPETTSGVVEEMTALAQAHLLEKVVVIMSPEEPQSIESRTRRWRWQKLRTALKAEGFSLPEYDPEGCMYLPHRDLSPRVCASLKRSEQSDDEGLKQGWAILLPHLLSKDGPRPLSEVMPLLARFESAPTCEPGRQ